LGHKKKEVKKKNATEKKVMFRQLGFRNERGGGEFFGLKEKGIGCNNQYTG